MNDDLRYYTPSMASVYSAQGHIEKAVEIYHYLLKQSPQRQDLAEALSVLEKKQGAGKSWSKTACGTRTENQEGYDLADLLENWIRILIRYKQLCSLQKGVKAFEKNPDSR